MRSGGAAGAAAVIAIEEPPAPPAFIDGETMPDATNTGPRYTMLTTEMGSLSSGYRQYNVTTPGSTFNRVRFECAVNVKAAGVSFADCEIVGDLINGPGSTQRALVTTTHIGATDPEFQFCLFEPALVHIKWSNAIQGHRFYAYRCRVRHLEDAFAFSTSAYSSTDCTVRCNYAHDFVYWQPDALGRPEGSHNDIVQHHNASGHKGNTVFGNHFDGAIDTAEGDYGPSHPDYPEVWAYSGLMFAPQGIGTQITGTYQKNWIRNVQVGFNIGWNPSTHALHVDYNRFYNDTFQYVGGGVIKPSAFHFTGSSSLTGNVNIDGADIETPFTAGEFSGTWP